jgi:hypothetical protein
LHLQLSAYAPKNNLSIKYPAIFNRDGGEVLFLRKYSLTKLPALSSRQQLICSGLQSSFCLYGVLPGSYSIWEGTRWDAVPFTDFSKTAGLFPEEIFLGRYCVGTYGKVRTCEPK